MTDNKIILDWFGLKMGPVVHDDTNKRFSYFHEYPGNDPEYFELIQRFEEKYPNKESATFGEDFKTFAEENGYDVTKNVYVTESYQKYLYESMTQDEVDEFVERLKAGEVTFKFKKVDGSTREARGTLKQDLIPSRPTPERVEGARKTHRVPDTVIVYWDLDKEAFRSFKKDNFDGYVD